MGLVAIAVLVANVFYGLFMYAFCFLKLVQGEPFPLTNVASGTFNFMVAYLVWCTRP